MWNALEQALLAEPTTPFAVPLVDVLRGRVPPAAQALRLLRVLDAHPWCSVRAGALRLRHAVTLGEASPEATIQAAQAAMESPCWRLQAAGRAALRQLGVAPVYGAHVASFLRDDAGVRSAAGGHEETLEGREP